MTFEIIPVIDLMNGQVVHAKNGSRENYQVLESNIIETTDSYSVCNFFINHYGLSQIYIADLDAITNQGNHETIINSLLNNFPELFIWLDSGKKFLSLTNPEQQRYSPIIGTEMNITVDQLVDYIQQHPKLILSLDFNENGFIGNSEILNHPEHWPNKIILMNLDRVGSETGVNINRIKTIQSKLHDQQRLYLAGGIRNQSDLKTLEQLGITGALISTALHDGSIYPSV